ncbi:MAG: hypothetical protein L0Z50_31995 [Verrucomicrobiales bacterium]|nr:hypothetical protein [Verrucomicrobiales bacterium]
MKYKFSLVSVSLLVILSTTLAPIRPAQASPSGTWSPAGSMAIGRARHTATLLTDGRVLVVGGLARVGGAFVTLSSVELYDPTTNTWGSAGSMSIARSRHTATRLFDGKVLVAGGRRSDSGPTLATAELYDPSTGTWGSTGSMADARDNFAAVLLPDGRVLVAGGVSGDPANGGFVEKSTEIYDPQTGAWHTVDHMANARFGHQATLLADGRVLVTGGANSGGHCVYSVTAEIYDPQTDTWRNVEPMGTARGFHIATRLLDGRVLVAGGWTLPACLITGTATAEVYDPMTGHWSQIGGMTIARGALVFHSTDALLSDGRVLATGGETPDGSTTATAELFDPATGTWSFTGSMAAARSAHTTTLLNDGRLLVTGGGHGTGPLSTAEVYTP